MFFLVCFGSSYISGKINAARILSVFKGGYYTDLCTISVLCAIGLIAVSLIISIIVYNNKELV